MNPAPMDAEAFKKSLGKYWTHTLNRIDPSYRDMLVSFVKRMEESPIPPSSREIVHSWDQLMRESCITLLCNEADTLLSEMAGLRKDYIPVLFHEAEAMSRHDPLATYSLLHHMPAVMRAENGRYCEEWTETVGRVVRTNAKQAQELVSMVGEKLDILSTLDTSYPGLLVQASHKVALIYPKDTLAIAKRMPEILYRAKPSTPEELLYHCIQDQRSARIIPNLIDVDRYRRTAHTETP